MTSKPQDLAALKQTLRSVARDAASRFADVLVEHPPGLIPYLVNECWPSKDNVITSVANEVEARQSEGDSDG